MNYATKIKTAIASALCVMVGMASAITVTNDVQIYGATFESAGAPSVSNDYAYANGAAITNYVTLDNGVPVSGWFAGSEDDGSVVTNLANAAGQVLLLNTEAEILTNKLASGIATEVNDAIACGQIGTDGIGTYQSAVFESDVKFVASDTLDPGITGGTDATKFAIYAYCDDSQDGNPTNLVVYHAIRPKRGATTYTNYVFSSVDVDTTEYTHLRVEMKQISNSGNLYDVFSVTVGSGENAVTLENEFASETRFGNAVTGNWFFTIENTSVAANQSVSSLNFKGTGEIDNIKISQKIQETYQAIVTNKKFAVWADAAAEAIAANATLESFEAGQSLELAADGHIAVSGEQPTVTTVSGYKVVTSDPVDGVYTYTSVLDKATVLFYAYDGTTILYSNDFTIGTAPVYGGTTPTKPADASGVYTWNGWTSGGVDYGTSDALANVVVGGAIYTATFSTAASVASVNGQYYASLADAVAHAADGSTVTLLGNTTLDARIEPNVGENTTLIIDLGGYTITRTGTSGNGSAFDIKSGNVIITNGVINCTQDDTAIAKDGVYAITSRDGSNVTLADLVVLVNSECGACAYPFAGSTMTIESGAYSNLTQTAYRYNTAITGMAVNQPNNATQNLFINGGTFSQYDPQLGDDSGAMTDFTAEGFVAIADGNGGWVVQPGFNVTFDADGGLPAPEAQRIAAGGTATAPVTNPSKAGSVFAGWMLNNAAYDFDTVLSADIELVAAYDGAKATVITITGTTTNVLGSYDSLAAAVTAAPAGSTILLLADDNVSFAGVTVTDRIPANGSVVIDKNLTIDGCGHKVYGVSNAEILNATGSATPGYDMAADLVNGSNLLGFFVKSGDVTFKNITLTEFGDTAYVNKFGYTPIQTASAYADDLVLENVTIDKFNRTAVCVRGGTLSITGGTITANATHKTTDHFQQPVEIRGGTATIDGLTVNSDIAYENGGGAIVAWSDTSLNNVVVDFTGVGVWADYEDITITGADTSIEATDKALFVEDAGSITVEAGDFTGTLAVDAVAGSAITVNGGTFDREVPEEFAGTGLWPTVEREGKYTVDIKRTVTFTVDGATYATEYVADGDPVATPATDPTKANYVFTGWTLSGAAYDFATPVTGDITLVAAFGDAKATVISVADGTQTYYGDLAAAVAAANSGDTVKLLDDVALTARVEPNLGSGTSLTIDLGGYEITRTGTDGNGSAFDVKSGNVVITNGTITCTQDDTAIAKDGVYAITSRDGSNVTLADLTVTVDSECGACAYPFAGSTMTIESGTYANVTTTPYRYNTAITGMAVNQPNNATQNLIIKGGSFSQYDPQLGDDSGAMTDFTDEGFVAIQDGSGNWVVQEGYNVTFDANGGTPAPEAQRVAAGDPATAPTAPTKASADGTNYTFRAWQLSGVDYDFVAAIASDCTLVADYTATAESSAITFPDSDTEIPAGDLLNWITDNGFDQNAVDNADTTAKLMECYLLNCTPGTSNGGTITVSAITVGDDVKVTVTLARTGKISQAIKGKLYLYGASSLTGGFSKIGDALIEYDDDTGKFSDDDTVEVTFSGSGLKFFKAVIE